MRTCQAGVQQSAGRGMRPLDTFGRDRGVVFDAKRRRYVEFLRCSLYPGTPLSVLKNMALILLMRLDGLLEILE